jgi:phage tail tube protein FII
MPMIQTLQPTVHWNAIFTTTDTTPVVVKPSGIITDLTLPSLTREVDDTVRAGELGVVPRPKKYGELEVSFTLAAIFDTLHQTLVKGTNQTLIMEAVTCVIPDSGAAVAHKVECRGFVTELPLGELSEDGYEAEITMMCWYLKVTMGTKITIYDPRNYVLSVDGTNLFASVATIIDPP